MPHRPMNNRFLPFDNGVNHPRYGFKLESVTDAEATEEMRARMLRSPQHGNTTTYTNSLEDVSSQSDTRMRCPHYLCNPHLPIKYHSCEEMFSDIETLKLHIREAHGFCLEGNFDSSSQRENYVSVWRELFAEYRREIPPASGLSPDDMRRMQNTRMFDVIKGYTWNRLGPRQEITREELEEIFRSFQSTSDFLIITEATGFCGTTGAPAGPATVHQHHHAHKPDTLRRGQDLKASLDASESAVSKKENHNMASDDDTIGSIDQHKVDEIMEKYRELTQSCSERRYEDEEIGQDQGAFDHPNLDRISRGSIRSLNSPDDVGEGPGKTMHGANKNGRSRTASAQSSTTNRNIKRGHSGSSSGGNDDEDGGRKRRRQSNVRNKSIANNAAKFACPYAKHAPDEPYKAASCCYPGFPSVSRVKEHIYRTHAALIQCPRCFNSFEDEDGLTNHLRDADRCPQLHEKPNTKTITVEQERKLRSKMKSDAPEELKWRQVYRIIFNLDDDSDTPSPYNDRSSSAFQLFSRYEQHCREALPSLVESEIKQAMTHAPIEMGESLQSMLVEIVLKCQENLFASFRGSEPAAPRQHLDPNPVGSQYNYMELPLINPEIWEFNLEGTDLGVGQFL